MLQGLRVLDLSRVLAGPLAAMTLGDLGADVIKVERPGSGDETRGWGPPNDPRGEAAYYLSINRNKLGIALSLDDADDRSLLDRLIRESDVVLDNYKRGTLERRGLVPERYLVEQPSLIWCTVTGFGAESERPGYDFVVQAEAGWMSVTGPREGEPTKAGIALADVTAGKDVAQNVLVSGQPARRWGNGHPNLVPYQLFQAADRYLVVAVGNDGQWQGCCRALGLNAMGTDSSVATNSGRLAHRERVIATMAARLSERTAGEWIAELEREGVPCGVVKEVGDALAPLAASPLTGVPPAVPGTVRLAPPMLDEHGELVRMYGWDVPTALGVGRAGAAPRPRFVRARGRPVTPSAPSRAET
jgi:crotonobetainyl-CoA:carnitine CoA-transferase CaiB-like acyl-CoA transferase